MSFLFKLLKYALKFYIHTLEKADSANDCDKKSIHVKVHTCLNGNAPKNRYLTSPTETINVLVDIYTNICDFTLKTKCLR